MIAMDTEPRSRTYQSLRLQLHYMEWGQADAPVLILQHGWADHARSWDWVAARLQHEYRVIAPDMRGHGDSAWSPDGDYAMESFVHDFAELVKSLQQSPVRIIAHSLGGNVAIRYAGLYPANVSRLVAIEGLGPSPQQLAERRAGMTVLDRWRKWIEQRQLLTVRGQRRYPTIEAAMERLWSANKRLDADRARHLTTHGLRQHADAVGGYSWKYDPLARARPPFDLPQAEIERLWSEITCPTLMCYGAESWASNPAVDGRAAHFRHGQVSLYEGAAHWVHHDQFERFVREVGDFLR
jgi:pimeloyl-ACP methyl ester carboxylesterase